MTIPKHWAIPTVCILMWSAAAMADTTIAKKPDLGNFWFPLDPNNGSYVYADFFIAPPGDVRVKRIGTWLDDQASGGSTVRLEIWGDNSGPDASQVISSTGSVSPTIGGGLAFNEYNASPGHLVAGQPYWFVATVVGEAGPGHWQVGGHTQNSGGIVDNGTFWYSNDPAGVNFDGQNLTPEMAFTVTLGAPINYYLRSAAGAPWGVNNNELAMTAVFGPNWADDRYETVDVGRLFNDPTNFIYMEGSDIDADELAAFIAANKTAMQDWVNGGGCLLMTSAPNEGSGFAMGFGEKLNYPPEFGDTLQVIDPSYPPALGPFFPAGPKYVGNSASHAYLTGAATPTAVNEFGNATIADLVFGAGGVVFGGITTANWWDPDPNADNFRANLIVHACHVGVDTDTGYAIDTDNHLYKINLSNAVESDVGDMGVFLESIAQRPSDGQLFGADTGGNFYTIDRNTGLATFLGASGLGNVEGLDFNGNGNTLWASDFNSPPSLYTINQSNGSATLMVTADADTGFLRSLAFTGDGRVIAPSDNLGLIYISLVSGHVDVIGPLGVFTAAVDFGQTAILYGLGSSGEVYRLSRSDGLAALVGNAGGHFYVGLTAGVAQPKCYPDCTGDGKLDLFDFLCFVNDFNVNGAYSNCDGNGTHDLFDFLCYVNSFNAGC